ncbi:MAG: spore coat protein CotJB [Lachnospiraceae bacterium]|nr:spore coat protein CotJB [Lachnospiraceae bacterium]RKJ68385.1 spore coat protein CotJB [Roseburia sp. 1XD42-69]
MQMLNQNMNQEKMLQWINEVSFAVTDVLLYLDTHPDDVDAMNYFNHYNMEREKALNLYASQYTPLVLSNTEACNHWNWVTDPWPWEGGCK